MLKQDSKRPLWPWISLGLSLSYEFTSFVYRWPMCHIYDPLGAPKNKPKYAQTNQIFHCPCSDRVARGHHGCKSFIKHPCHVISFYLLCVRTVHMSHLWSPRPTQAQKTGQNMPQLSRLTHSTPCPCSNRVAGGHHGLKSPIEGLCHVNLFHLYLSGPLATSMTLGDFLRTKEPARVFPN